MGRKAIANSTLMLRVFTLLFLAACVVLMVLNNVTHGVIKRTFKDYIAYRYVLATACVGLAYTMIQIPFALYLAIKEKRLIRHRCLPEFDFYADKVMGLYLASGVGVGFGASVELKRQLHGRDGTDKILDRGMVAAGILLGGVVCMALLSLLSSTARHTTKSFF